MGERNIEQYIIYLLELSKQWLILYITGVTVASRDFAKMI